MRMQEKETSSWVASQLIQFADYLEKINFSDYVLLLTKPWRLIWINFLAGLSRGVGIGLGFTLLAATLVLILQELNVMNLPVIGRYIADLVRIVEAELHTPQIH
jgi:hypothetical protein